MSKGSPSPFPDSDWPRPSRPPARPPADWLRAAGRRRRPGAAGRPGPSGGRWGRDRRLLRALPSRRLESWSAGQARGARRERDCPALAMKSLKSRLRRQDAPGPLLSGAATSAVSAAARARPGLPALPSESPPGSEARSSLGVPSARPPRRPGASSSHRPGLRVGPETLGTLPTRRAPSRCSPPGL